MTEMSNEEAQRLLVQGYVAGVLYARDDVHVEQDTDDAGVYLPWFDVTTEMGARARVHVQQAPGERQDLGASPGGLDAPENAQASAIHSAIRQGLRDHGSRTGQPRGLLDSGVVPELTDDQRSFLTGVLTSRVLHALGKLERADVPRRDDDPPHPS